MNSINHPRLGIKLYYWAYRNICVRVISYFPVSMGGCITSNFLTATWWTFELRSLHPPNAWSCQIEGQKLTSLYTVFGFQVAKIQLRLGPLESANKPSWCQLQSFDWLGLHSRLNNLQLSKNRSNKLWPFCGQHAMWQGWESSKLDKQRSINLSIRHGSNMLLLSGAPTPVVLSQLGKVGEDRLNLQLVQLQHPSRHRLNLTNMWCHDDPLTAFQVTQVLFVHNPFEDWRWVFIHFVLCTSHNLLGPHLIRWFVQENSNLKPNRGHSPNTKKGIHFPHYEAAGNGWPVEGWRCCLANAVWHFLYHHKLDTSSALGENSLGHFIHVGSCRHPFRPTPTSPASPTSPSPKTEVLRLARTLPATMLWPFAGLAWCWVGSWVALHHEVTGLQWTLAGYANAGHGWCRKRGGVIGKPWARNFSSFEDGEKDVND